MSVNALYTDLSDYYDRMCADSTIRRKATVSKGCSNCLATAVLVT